MTSMKISNFLTPLPCHIHDHATYQYSCPLFDYPPSSTDVIDGSPLMLTLSLTDMFPKSGPVRGGLDLKIQSLDLRAISIMNISAIGLI